MKELSIEEKAKRYDEAIERAKEKQAAYLELSGGEYGGEDIVYIFPELAEREDEEDKRIRENAIQIIRYSMNGVDVALPLSIYKECIAWLEKHCEQKTVNMNAIKNKAHQIGWETSKHYDPNVCKQEWCEMAAMDIACWLEKQGEKTNPYSGISFEYNGHTWGMCARDNGVDILLDKQLFKHLDEKQGEQPSANKVEPKFKVGDCITNNCAVWFIEGVHDGLYDLKGPNGGVSKNVESNVITDNNFHLWTIQDAKVGDVLEFEDHERVVIGIVSFVNEKTGKVDVSCLLEDNKFKIGNFYTLDTINPHPATKEQRDLLFQKMREAGYEWDAEKKKLKKIEQKSAWSEEDEDKVKTVLYLLHEVADNYNFDEWLKGFKDRTNK